MKKGESRTAYLFLLPSLMGTAVFVFIPFADVVRRSFFQAVGGTFVGLLNYREVLGNEMFQRALYNTVKFLVICLPLLLMLSFFLAVLTYRLGRTGKVFGVVYLLPMAVPVASIVVFWKLLFHEQGLVNEALGWIHISGKDWMGSESAFAVLVFSYIWKNLGYDMVLWSAALAGIPSEQYEAAKVSGANEIQCFYYITLPQMRSSGSMIALLSFVNAFRVFREAYLIAGDYPHSSIYMLQHLFNNWFTKLDIQKMSAAAVMMAIAVSIMMVWGVTRQEDKE